MKKAKSIICIILGSFLLIACGSQTGTRDTNSMQQGATMFEQYSGLTDANPYFFDKSVTKFSLSGEMNFNKWDDAGESHDQVEYSIKKIGEKPDGDIYIIQADQFDHNKIPSDRLNIGYFYVQKNKITRLVEDRESPWNLSEKALSDFEKKDILPQYSTVVCQEQEIQDKLTPNYKKGWHSYIEISGKVVKYGQYQNVVSAQNRESYFWEHIYWEKGKGITGYDCGYKAGVDYFRLGRSYEG